MSSSMSMSMSTSASASSASSPDPPPQEGANILPNLIQPIRQSRRHQEEASDRTGHRFLQGQNVRAGPQGSEGPRRPRRPPLLRGRPDQAVQAPPQAGIYQRPRRGYGTRQRWHSAGLHRHGEIGATPGAAAAAAPLTIKDLVDAGITNSTSVKHGIKLLGKGRHRLRTPIRLEVSRASAKAVDAIERVGGSVTTVHYNRLALRALLKPEKFDDNDDDEEEDGDGGGRRKIVPRRARPPPKLMPYYTSYDKRGYLAPEVQLKKIEERLGKVSVADDDDK